MLSGEVKQIDKFTEEEISSMYRLMCEFYDDTKEDVFRRDFLNKDYCLVLYSASNVLVGFTTQKVLKVDVAGKTVHGVFSGDTIIHKDYWGDMELFKVWANFWFPYAEKYDEFYWFLICKGYKTYRMLPLFWTEFYPNYKIETPDYEKRIMEAYGKILYPDDYNAKSGVVEYKAKKDKLKSGVADIGEKELKNKDVAFFCQKNPNYIEGNDLVCLAKIQKKMLKKKVQEFLFHEPSM